MTQYFDIKGQEIASAGADEVYGGGRLLKIEAQMVYDVLLATTFPGFPEDIAAAIKHAIRVHGVECRPDLDPPADFDDQRGHAQQLGRLEYDLHSAFHALAQRGLEGFSDSPLVPPLRAVSFIQEEMENDAAALKLLRDLLAVLLDPDVAVCYALGPPPAPGWHPNVERGTWEKWLPRGGARVVVTYTPRASERWGVRCDDFTADTVVRTCASSLAEAVETCEAWLAEVAAGQATTKAE